MARNANTVGVPEPRRLTLAEQWECLARVIEGAASHTEEAMRYHTLAAMQLDAVQYTLTSLVDDLAVVTDVGGLRKQATVHVLEIPLPRSVGDAIAA